MSWQRIVDLFLAFFGIVSQFAWIYGLCNKSRWVLMRQLIYALNAAADINSCFVDFLVLPQRLSRYLDW